MQIPRWSRSRRVASTLPRLSRHSIVRCTVLAVFILIVTIGCKSKKQSSVAEESASQAAPRDSIELTFTYGSEKERWINEVTDKFNREDHRAQGGRRIFVRAIPMGSGECIDEVLDGTRHPHLISPEYGAFIT